MRTVPLRRWVVAGSVALVPFALIAAGGHAGTHAARSLLVPGLGLAEARPVLGVLCFAAAVAATVAWLRWGTDWALVVVVAGAMAASAAWGSGDHGDDIAVRVAAHEFPMVIAIAGAIGWVRVTLGGVPGFGWLRGRRTREDAVTTLADLPPVDRCRAVAVLGLAGAIDDDARAAITAPDVGRRARRIGLAARGRRTADPFAVDHAPARAARALAGVMSADELERFTHDARRTAAGVPASEPTWVRPLDATLAAAALSAASDGEAPSRWARMLDGPLAIRRGHRPAWWWSPLGLAAGRSLDWEHAATTAIARAHGWIGDDDWSVLRRRVLGAAARGVARRDDERLIAAGRAWLALVDDPDAARIVARPTVRHDPLAVALDRYATHLAARTTVFAGGTTR